MRDASHAAENFSNWFSQVNVQNFAVSFQGGPPGLMAHDASTAVPANDKKRKADQQEEVTGKKKRVPKEKKPKDKDAPKRPASAYLLYQNDIRKVIKEQNPSISNQELLQIIAKTWALLDPEKRKPYIAQHEKLKGVYDIAKEIYDNKNNPREQDISPVEKPKSKSSITKSEVKAPEEDDEDDEELEASAVASAAASASTEVTSSSQPSSDEEEEEEEEEENEASTPEPPKKKHKIKASTPPPPVKSDKNKKKHKHVDKK